MPVTNVWRLQDEDDRTCGRGGSTRHAVFRPLPPRSDCRTRSSRIVRRASLGLEACVDGASSVEPLAKQAEILAPIPFVSNPGPADHLQLPPPPLFSALSNCYRSEPRLSHWRMQVDCRSAAWRDEGRSASLFVFHCTLPRACLASLLPPSPFPLPSQSCRIPTRLPTLERMDVGPSKVAIPVSPEATCPRIAASRISQLGRMYAPAHVRRISRRIINGLWMANGERRTANGERRTANGVSSHSQPPPPPLRRSRLGPPPPSF
ncbi:hypothetical protein L227DRAFT_155376 [Lentinus tigrinus ALCF2SS1-6]|uniref:Uncharacterized protein n=1 Tax=Lentinus tigrinus ALCF2SS1-6 TaxID=1328759 RepID=A0A5C2S742_9APHY|nr:hypothetical protein L227DRAFT_155376 [Lentinus tigrinus ALCF2SS1-6]